MMLYHQVTVKNVTNKKDCHIVELTCGDGFVLRKGNITPRKGDIITTTHINPFNFHSPAKSIYINGKIWHA
jgi:hypothetical protein